MNTLVQPWFMDCSPDLVGTASPRVSLNVLRVATAVLDQLTKKSGKRMKYMEEKALS